ncbi:MAG TPA: hypothetical protein VFC69_05030 [Dysgonamonadaceae bacterium]|nr:hypothetical protein [Dysgonamonadaceae bacterium]
MKKVLFALAILPLLAFASCSSDDDETPDVSDIDFAHNIELLYGKWRATGVEGVGEDVIDLTQPPFDEIVPATYVTFKKDGIYSSEGILGEGTGEYTTKDKTITVATGENKEDKISFEMTSLVAETAKIKINAKSLDLPIIPEELEEVTVVLTKQKEEK